MNSTRGPRRLVSQRSLGLTRSVERKGPWGQTTISINTGEQEEVPVVVTRIGLKTPIVTVKTTGLLTLRLLPSLELLVHEIDTTHSDRSRSFPHFRVAPSPYTYDAPTLPAPRTGQYALPRGRRRSRTEKMGDGTHSERNRK